ncbi:M23 family metallopeptidase [Pseudonocardia sediminis]|nr:M23 family metallopeptidase [Pseudonocardia sediminis]
MTSALERHPGPGGTMSPDMSLQPATAGGESHGPPALDSLTKASRLADDLARLASTRSEAMAAGAPDAAMTRDGASFVKPTTGTLTSSAGPRWGSTHYGLDIANRIGTPIFAVADGVVIDSGPASGFGLWVRIRHQDGSISIYGHIDRSLVKRGQTVRAGDRIALMGNRGQSTGSHLHLEIRDEGGTKLDPQTWLRKRGISVE